MQDDLPEVSMQSISQVASLLENKATQAKLTYMTDESINSYVQLLTALKQGRIPGNAIVEWKDEKGRLQVNVVDFLRSLKVKALDPDSGEKVVVEIKKIPDGSWRVLY